MYVDPFIAGIVCGVLCTLGALVIVALIVGKVK
jgi:hypothetical protein